MTEEIKYYKEKEYPLKWIPAEEMEETSQQTIDRLKQENKELKKQLSSTKCYLCGEGFLTPEGAELYEEKERYRSALEEIRNLVKGHKVADEVRLKSILDKINECLGE